MAMPIIYKDKSWKGASQELNTVAYENSKQLGIGNDSLSSLRVPPGMTVLLYEDSKYRGKCKRCLYDLEDVGSMNDKTSSIVVIPSLLVTSIIEIASNPQASGEALAQSFEQLFRWAGESLSRDMNTVLRVLADSGVPRGELAKQSVAYFNTSIDAVVRGMEMSAEQTAKVLKDTFRWSAQKTGKFLKDAMGFGKGTVEDALEGAGYAKSEVEGFLSSVGKWGEDLGRDIADAFGL